MSACRMRVDNLPFFALFVGSKWEIVHSRHLQGVYSWPSFWAYNGYWLAALKVCPLRSYFYS